MKDTNDNATLDWVNEFLDEYPQAVAQAQLQLDDMFNSGLLIAPPENPALNTALSTIVNITLQDLLAEYN